MVMNALQAGLDSARAQFDKVSDTSRKMSLVGDGLASLAKLGNLVEPDDVIRESSKLVASGIDPHQLASLLAQMPQTGGEPLQAWLMGHIQALAQAQAQFEPIHESSRHQLAQAALGVLLGHHLGAPAGGQQAGPGAPPPGAGPRNDLTTPSPGMAHPPGEYIEPPPAGPPEANPPGNPLELMAPQGRA